MHTIVSAFFVQKLKVDLSIIIQKYKYLITQGHHASN